jgi:hypothetical protein
VRFAPIVTGIDLAYSIDVATQTKIYDAAVENVPHCIKPVSTTITANIAGCTECLCVATVLVECELPAVARANH